ncbi:MAG: ribulose-phosphate 3-epimerase [Lachnospiraceae bacterium]|nr:ribulose-phosphate 3-epimerase [Lachnospiraceae bacterium]
MILSPSILSADFAELGQQIKAVDEAGAQYLHIDIMDGVFVPSISFGMPVVQSIRKVSDIVFDVHLMIVEPERYIKEFAEAGADIITFHLEATRKPQEVIDLIHACGKKAGITIKPGTPVTDLIPYLEQVELVLIMTVEPGFGGQKLIPETIEKVREVKKLMAEKNLQFELEVDGGVNRENVQTLIDAGAGVFVAGSAVYKGNVQDNVKFFLAQK